MKYEYSCFLIILYNICLVTSANIHDDNTKIIDGNRVKRRVPILSNAKPLTSSKAIDKPCDVYDPPQPNFAVQGRRISEIKCYETIWQMKVRSDQAKRSKECLESKGVFIKNVIIGGQDAEYGQFPHMGAIGWKAKIGTWVFKCGGSLISPKFVLTAAHCTRVSEVDTTVADPVPQIVRLGDINISDKYDLGVWPQNEVITRIIKHPKYASPSKYYDIALLQIKFEVNITRYVQPACLWNRFDIHNLGKIAKVTGWGVIETATRKTTPRLQTADVDFIDTKQCNNLLDRYCSKYFCGVQDHQMCAGKLKGGVDSCQGDSGGPLNVPINLPVTTEGTLNYVVGVTSFGIGCAEKDTPGVYTRVSSFIDWIESEVWP